MAVKTNIELAKMIEVFAAGNYEAGQSDALGDLLNAAREVLVAVDDIETSSQPWGATSVENAIPWLLEHRDTLDKHSMEYSLIGTVCGYASRARESLVKRKDELGNMGVALGLVEGQRDDAVLALESASETMAHCGLRLANMHILMSRELVSAGLEADSAIVKCKGGK